MHSIAFVSKLFNQLFNLRKIFELIGQIFYIFRIHNEIAATYESATSRKFLHGRTETIRSASIEALDFCKMMADKSASVSAKSAAMRNAIDAHKKYVTQVFIIYFN